MRVREAQRNDVEAVSGLMVPSTTGGLVRIDSVARLERGTGPTSITRLDRQFSVGVSSDIRPGVALDAAVPVVRDEIKKLKLPAGYRAKFAGQSKVLDETATNMIIAISLASIFVYMVLVAQFESFVQPIIIMTALPLSVPFALLTLRPHPPAAQPVEHARRPAAARHRQEELDSAGRLHQRPAAGAACRCAKR